MGIPLIREKELFVELVAEEDTVKVIGSVDNQCSEQLLASFFEKVHKSILNHRVKFINFDISRLSYINSSGIKNVIEWIAKLDTIPNKEKYTINIKINQDYRWQDNSISILVNLCPDYVKKEIIV